MRTATVAPRAGRERLCDRLGDFVHHRPERPDAGYAPAWFRRTQDAIRLADLWTDPDDNTISVPVPAQHTPHGPNCAPIVLIPKPKPKG